MPNFPYVNPKLTTDFTKLYVLNIEKLNLVEEYMVNPSYVGAIVKFFTSPNECIQSIRYYPFNIPSIFSGMLPQENIKLGGVELVSGNDKIPSLYIPNGAMNELKVNVGKIVINKSDLYGNYLDLRNVYRLYLPYLETITLDSEQVTPVGDEEYVEIFIDYVVNFLTGGLTGYVYRYSDNKLIILHIVNGTIGIDIPISLSNANDVVKNVMLGSLGFVMSGGTNLSSLMTDTQVHFNQIGGFSDGLGKLFAPQEVHLLIERPIKSEPSSYAKMNGYPLNQTRTLNAIRGYTELDSIYLDDVESITNEEKNELEELLLSGVYF